ncbi:hypothetical protein [Protofrankia coriariae]|uniref:hypothetical protein n=1 Tax=Protofrankia coriariae TaxID=1562887 RepID=UPI000699F39F|nr:hypothetical protein [Protofrankia coriariae]
MTRRKILLSAVTAVCVTVGLLVGLRATGVFGPSAGDSGGTRPVAAENTLGAGNRDLSGRIQPHGNGRPSPATLWVDGCDHNYVKASDNMNVCVPKIAPGGVPVDCEFLRKSGFGALKVTGTDSKNLAGTGGNAPRGTTVCAD